MITVWEIAIAWAVVGILIVIWDRYEARQRRRKRWT
jgi:hypothetical protein